MIRKEYLNSLSKQDILNTIGWYLLENKDIPDDITPEDIWETIIDLEILNVI